MGTAAPSLSAIILYLFIFFRLLLLVLTAAVVSLESHYESENCAASAAMPEDRSLA